MHFQPFNELKKIFFGTPSLRLLAHWRSAQNALCAARLQAISISGHLNGNVEGEGGEGKREWGGGGGGGGMVFRLAGG